MAALTLAEELRRIALGTEKDPELEDFASTYGVKLRTWMLAEARQKETLIHVSPSFIGVSRNYTLDDFAQLQAVLVAERWARKNELQFNIDTRDGIVIGIVFAWGQ